MNIKVEECNNPAQDVKAFVRNLVQENSESLSMFIYNQTSALHSYLAQREVTRAQMILENVGAKSHTRADLFIATEQETGARIGFALLAPHLNNPNGAAIIMIAVSAESRKKGVFTQIINCIKQKYCDNLTLSCKPEMVNFYKNFGFIPVGVRQTQIAMSLAPEISGGGISTVDDAEVMKNPKVIQKYTDLITRRGKAAVEKEVEKWQADFVRGEQYAEQFWKELQSV